MLGAWRSAQLAAGCVLVYPPKAAESSGFRRHPGAARWRVACAPAEGRRDLTSVSTSSTATQARSPRSGPSCTTHARPTRARHSRGTRAPRRRCRQDTLHARQQQHGGSCGSTARFTSRRAMQVVAEAECSMFGAGILRVAEAVAHGFDAAAARGDGSLFSMLW
ncbi:hypothetical protein GGX14DRAFT_405485 [Mycena pura]|uniref:Uncharacterized protein n=1 Tax=Mycena pura TaxID=153505 RepID=A0AAD6USA7_9AGAR|nr:hypothetical protein GGX14DRAFT_405485 [Mycena pura]